MASNASAIPASGFRRGMLKRVFSSLLSIAWLLLGLFMMSIGRFVRFFDFCYQICRTLYYWSDPRVHAGWTFLLHFLAWLAIEIFLTSYTPGDSKR
jgi:hypothetical protein